MSRKLQWGILNGSFFLGFHFNQPQERERSSKQDTPKRFPTSGAPRAHPLSRFHAQDARGAGAHGRVAAAEPLPAGRRAPRAQVMRGKWRTAGCAGLTYCGWTKSCTTWKTVCMQNVAPKLINPSSIIWGWAPPKVMNLH